MNIQVVTPTYHPRYSMFYHDHSAATITVCGISIIRPLKKRWRVGNNLKFSIFTEETTAIEVITNYLSWV